MCNKVTKRKKPKEFYQENEQKREFFVKSSELFMASGSHLCCSEII